MFQYINKTTKVSDVPFVILDKPIRVYTTNFAYSKEKASEQYDLPRNINCYLVDESLAPYDKVKDVNGDEISNLVYFSKESTHKVVMNGEEKEITPVDYNFFNYFAPVMIEDKNKKPVEYRRKWLDARMRTNVSFLTPCNTKLWDKEAKAEVDTLVTHAKLDIPTGTFKTIEGHLETIQDAKEDDSITLADCEVTIKYDETKPPAEVYTTKVKPLKSKINIEEELENFKKQKPEFVPPATPF